jgi:anti-sigma factor RsiW
MKRRDIVHVCLFAIAASSVAVLLATWDSRRHHVDVRWETCERLQLGMSENAVEEILGGPAGDYTTRSDVIHTSVGSWASDGQTSRPPEPVTTRVWSTNEYMIAVDFNAEGNAVRIAGARGLSPPPSMRYPPPLRQLMQLMDP